MNFDSPPTGLDWKEKGKTTPVKSQGNQCGADWAFATVAYAESKLIIDGRYDTSVSLSEQHVLECTSGSSCSVGYVEDAMNTVTGGLLFSTLYSWDPLNTHIGICQIPTIKLATKVENYYNINDNQLIQLLQERPVVAVVSSKNW